MDRVAVLRAVAITGIVLACFFLLFRIFNSDVAECQYARASVRNFAPCHDDPSCLLTARELSALLQGREKIEWCRENDIRY